MNYDGNVSEGNRGHSVETVEEQTKFQAELEELDGVVKAIEVEVNHLIGKLNMVLLPEKPIKAVEIGAAKDGEQSELLGIIKRITSRANTQRHELYSLRSRIEL